MNCIRCNAELKDDAKVCDSCGAEQTPSAPQPCCCCAAPAAPAAGGKKLPLGIVSLVLVLLGILLHVVTNFLLFNICGRLGFYPPVIIWHLLNFVFTVVKIAGAVLGIVAVCRKQWLGIVAIILGGLSLIYGLISFIVHRI